MDDCWTVWLDFDTAVHVDMDGKYTVRIPLSLAWATAAGGAAAVTLGRSRVCQMLDVDPCGPDVAQMPEPLPTEGLSEELELEGAAACGDMQFAVVDNPNKAMLVRSRRCPGRGPAGW